MTTFERSEDFEQPALNWLLHEAQQLRSALSGAGIDDEVVQRAICDDYIFGLANRLDGDEGRDSQEPQAALGFLSPEGARMADDTFSFHDYALGVVGEVFGDA